MAFNPVRTVLPYTGGTVTIVYEDNSAIAARDWNIIKYDETDNDYTVEITSKTSTGCTMTVTVEPNTGTVNKLHTFYLEKYVNLVSTARYTYTVQVEYDYANVVKPIWQDIFFTKPNTSFLEYNILDENNSTIYKGRSVSTPDSNNVVFNINRLCSNYLNSNLPSGFEEGYHLLNDYVKLFKITSPNNSTGGVETIAQYRFYNNYLYGKELNDVFISEPIRQSTDINGVKTMVVDKRQYTLCSVFNSKATDKTLLINIANSDKSTTINCVLNNKAQGLFIERSRYNTTDKLSTVYFVLDGYRYKYEVHKTCYDYCLYYCNAYGGWDSLLIDGNVKKTDKINSKYYTRDYNNTTIQSEKTKFLNVINTEYVLHTGWFNDDEQSRLHHLLESTEVYLHNLNTDEIYPVNITNNSCEYKTFTNNGRKKFNNTINVEVAQTKVRK